MREREWESEIVRVRKRLRTAKEPALVEIVSSQFWKVCCLFQYNIAATPEPSDEEEEDSDDDEDGFGSSKKKEEEQDPAASNKP